MAVKQPPSTIAQVKDVFTKLGEISDKVVFGDVWERKQLSKRDRSLITIAALTALYRPDQLRGHLHRAFDNGVTKEEIIEVITHLASTRAGRTAAAPPGGQGGVQGARRMKIGFIGLGAMGRPMAANLERAGHAVQRMTCGRGRARRTRGGSGAGLRGAVHVASRACRGGGGRGGVEILADRKCGLVRPEHQFADGCAPPSRGSRRKGIHFLDAPVSGGPKGAQSGKLAIWVGGDEAVFRRFESVLRAIGDQPYYVGPIGAGTVRSSRTTPRASPSRRRSRRCSRSG